MLELGCNHQGSTDIARALVDDAQRLGVFGIKFQKRHVEAIPEGVKGRPRDPATSFGDTYYAHRKALELDLDQVTALKRHAEDRGLVFAESVFDLRSLQDVIDVGVKCIKLPSQALLDHELNFKLVSQRRVAPNTFIVNSTGMHTVKEVLANPWLREFDATLYCRSIYPHRAGQADLGAARAIFGALGDPQRCGYSSHDLDGTLVPWLVLIGATWVERHYTLDKGMKGSDHGTVSSDFAEMQAILRQVEEVEDLLECKNYDRIASAEELANREFYTGVKR